MMDWAKEEFLSCIFAEEWTLARSEGKIAQSYADIAVSSAETVQCRCWCWIYARMWDLCQATDALVRQIGCHASCFLCNVFCGIVLMTVKHPVGPGRQTSASVSDQLHGKKKREKCNWLPSWFGSMWNISRPQRKSYMQILDFRHASILLPMTLR